MSKESKGSRCSGITPLAAEIGEGGRPGENVTEVDEEPEVSACHFSILQCCIGYRCGGKRGKKLCFDMFCAWIMCSTRRALKV